MSYLAASQDALVVNWPAPDHSGRTMRFGARYRVGSGVRWSAGVARARCGAFRGVY